MKVAIQRILEASTGALEGSHLADHWKNGWERTLGGIVRLKGNMNNGSGVDDGMDGFNIVIG